MTDFATRIIDAAHADGALDTPTTRRIAVAREPH